MTVLQHLNDRHMNMELHRPVVDEVGGVATFFLWNLSGQLVGYQQYRPNGDKKSVSRDTAKYFTYVTGASVSVWGVESLHLTPNVVFVCEGVFDACRLTKRGVSAVAVLSNDPSHSVRQWLKGLGRTVVVVADNDGAGRRLATAGDYLVHPDAHDLGEASEDFVALLLEKFV